MQYKYLLYYPMKTFSFIVLFLCLTITLGLKPKPQAQNHLRGKISQTLNHDMKKLQEHNANQQPIQHKQKLLGHQASYASNDHKHMAQDEQLPDHNEELKQDHELFGHHSSSSSRHEHEGAQNHKLEKHEWGSSSTTHHNHRMQGIKPRQHKKAQQNHKLFNDQTSSPTSSSDYRQYTHNQGTQNNEDNTDQQTTDNDQNYQTGHVNNNHKLEHDLSSTTNSYTSSRYHKHMGHDGNDQVLRTRHHRVEMHDEYSNDGGVNDDDVTDNDYDNDNDYDSDYTVNGQMSGQGKSQPGSYQAHRQNDKDEPHYGNKFYYVDENNIEHEVSSSSDTSSFKEPNLRDYVDYNNPLDPDHPLVRQETNVITTEVPDTIGAAKGANFDDDTSVSSSVISEYEKKKRQAREAEGKHEETDSTTQIIPPPPPPTPTVYTTTTTTQPSYTTYQPDTTTTTTQTGTGTTYEQDTSTSRKPYHKTQTFTDEGHHLDTTGSQSHNQYHKYKYQADAHHQQHKVQPYDDDDTNDNTHDDKQIDHKTVAGDDNRMEHEPSQPEHEPSQPEHKEATKAQESHKTDDSNTHTNTAVNHHLQYGTDSQHDDDNDDMNDNDDTNDDDTNDDDMNDGDHPYMNTMSGQSSGTQSNTNA